MIKKPRQKKYYAPQNEEVEHLCDHPGCNKKGEYRAPKDRSLKEYYWFCLEHVQEYNAKWNYYDGDEDFDEAAEKFQKFNFSSYIKYNIGLDFNEGYNIFKDLSFEEKKQFLKLTPNESFCLKIMDIKLEDLDVDSLKKAYKKAVKKYHPDLNSNDPSAEEKFKILSTSYKSIIEKLQKK